MQNNKIYFVFNYSTEDGRQFATVMEFNKHDNLLNIARKYKHAIDADGSIATLDVIMYADGKKHAEEIANNANTFNNIYNRLFRYVRIFEEVQ